MQIHLHGQHSSQGGSKGKVNTETYHFASARSFLHQRLNYSCRLCYKLLIVGGACSYSFDATPDFFRARLFFCYDLIHQGFIFWHYYNGYSGKPGSPFRTHMDHYDGGRKSRGLTVANPTDHADRQDQSLARTDNKRWEFDRMERVSTECPHSVFDPRAHRDEEPEARAASVRYK